MWAVSFLNIHFETILFWKGCVGLHDGYINHEQKIEQLLACQAKDWGTSSFDTWSVPRWGRKPARNGDFTGISAANMTSEWDLSIFYGFNLFESEVWRFILEISG